MFYEKKYCEIDYEICFSKKLERSGSVLKRLNSYLLESMDQQGLCGLAFLHINYDKDIASLTYLQTWKKAKSIIKVLKSNFEILFQKCNLQHSYNIPLKMMPEIC